MELDYVFNYLVSVNCHISVFFVGWANYNFGEKNRDTNYTAQIEICNIPFNRKNVRLVHKKSKTPNFYIGFN